MNKDIQLPAFDDEEAFKKWYLSQTTASEQIRGLHQWRLRQLKFVGAMSDMIRSLGGEQYTEVDHFLLELIQNADDNLYLADCSPSLTISLTQEGCCFLCNEAGFTAENVLAICYAAASTKTREPGKRSFIGEKGIGFKSLFAVAESVEIHSGNYHFLLKDKEYIVPHLLEGEFQPGSRIYLRFKPKMIEIASILSERFASLCEKAENFVLFLQQIQHLEIDDGISGKTTQIEIKRKKDRCEVHQNGQVDTFSIVRQTISFPAEVVQDRFSHMEGSLDREICFAVPLPRDLNKESFKGLLFCFLPTRVETCFPFHIQLDGKTVTNRENLESATRSRWNAHLLGQLSDALIALFCKLRDDRAFRNHLPLYFPNPNALKSGNDDFDHVLKSVVERIKTTPLALDRLGQYRPPSKLCVAPDEVKEWIETDQYSEGLDDAKEFLSKDWRKFSGILKSFSMKELSLLCLVNLTNLRGCPRTVEQALNEEEPRRFLRCWMDIKLFYDKWDEVQLAPIFPLRIGRSRKWGPLTKNTLLVSADKSDFQVPETTEIVDPLYTYSPGGNAPDEIRSFNERFRTYLTDKLAVKRASDAHYIEQVILPDAEKECAVPIRNERDLSAHTKIWINLYSRIWWRRKTIINDSSEERFKQMLKRIGDLLIPVRKKGDSTLKLCPLKDALLPQQWWEDSALFEAYVAIDLLEIALPLKETYYAEESSSRRGDSLKWEPEEWKEFFIACGAFRGPRLVDLIVSPGEKFPSGLEDLKGGCDEIFTNRRSPKITTIDFDPATCRLLQTNDQAPQLVDAISCLWSDIKKTKTIVEWKYRKICKEEVSDNAALCRLRNRLLLHTDFGMMDPAISVIDSAENQMIAKGLIPLVSHSQFHNESFLKYLGVLFDINESFLLKEASSAIHLPDPVDRSEASETVLSLIARIADHRKAERPWLRSAKIFPHLQQVQLLNYDDWLAQRGEEGYPENVINDLFESMKTVQSVGADEFLNELFLIGNLFGNEGKVVSWLKTLGNRLQKGNHEAIDQKFANRIREQGLPYLGMDIHSAEQLPLLWDFPAKPLSTTGIIALPNDPIELTAIRTAADLLGWAMVSKLKIQVANISAKPVDSICLKQIELTFLELQRLLSKTNSKDLSKSGLARLVQEGKLKVVEANEILLKIPRNKESPQVPFWKRDQTLFFDSRFIELPHAIGHILDAEAMTTLTPFIDSIFSKLEHSAKQAMASPRKVTGANVNATGDGGGAIDSTGQPESGAGKSPSNQVSGNVRKRLFSYVKPNQNGEKASAPKEASQAAKTKVELAGEKLLIDFCESKSLPCKDVTADNIGYDFEIKSPNGVFFVELKSSRDRWDHWENSLSVNEFRSAIEKGSHYVLCVAELVLEDNPSLIFIQDPWGLADGFLFDSPWKDVAIPANSLFGAHEEAVGAHPMRED